MSADIGGRLKALLRAPVAYLADRRTLDEVLRPRELVDPLNAVDYALNAERWATSFASIGGQFHSEGALELLSLRATQGDTGWEGLSDALLHGRVSAEELDRWSANPLLVSALYAGLLEDTVEQRRIARNALNLMLDRGETKVLTNPAFLLLACRVAVQENDVELLSRLSSVEGASRMALWAARFDLARPSGLDADTAGWAVETEQERRALDTWWAEFNRYYEDAGLEPWELRDTERLEAADFFEHIHAPEVPEAEAFGDARPRVTIIVPAYNPQPMFLNTIESLLRQSWRNIEILVVDDASSEGHEHIAAAEASDERVRVIRLEENGGAYRARNIGFREASGEFVTVLDADDLSHSRRIEHQLRPFFAEDGDSVVATVMRSIRMSIDGRVSSHLRPECLNTSSLLFRRERVIERIGYCDAVRKAADSEYLGRLVAAFPEMRLVEVSEPLGLIQLTAGSLSRTDFRAGGWHAGHRVAYRYQYEHWHRAQKAAPGGGDFYVPFGGAAPVAVPARIRGQIPRQDFEVAIARDWSRRIDGIDEWPAVAERIAGTVEGPVGLLKTAHPRRSSWRRYAPRERTLRLVGRGEAEWMSWEPETRVGTLLFADPEYLLFLPGAQEIGVRPQRVVIALENVIDVSGRRMATPDRELIEQACERSFGVTPEWVVSSDGLAEALLGTRRGAARGSDPRVRTGVFARTADPAESAAPARATGTVVGVVNTGFSDEVRGPKRRLLGQLPVDRDSVLWERILPETPHYETQKGIIADADIVVIDPFDVCSGVRHDLVWSALQRGAAVVAPERYGLLYGDLVVTASGDAVGTAVERLLAPDARQERVDRVRRLLVERDAVPRLLGE